MLNIQDIPLLPFFLRWREHERSYGRLTSDPEALLLLQKQLAEGRGLFRKEDLLLLCKTIMLKPGHNEEDFERMFYQYLASIKHPLEASEPKDTTEVSDTNQTTEKSNVKDTSQTTDPAEQVEEKQEEPDTRQAPVQEQQETISIYFEDAERGVEGIPMAGGERDINQHIFQQAFILKGDDYLLPGRVLQQAWRSMRTLQEVGPKRILDLEATLRTVAETGFLGAAELRAEYQNTAKLTILIDASPSMVAFKGMAEKLVHTAGQERHFQDLQVYYFDNLPEEYLFREADLFDPIKLRLFLQQPRHAVLIFSDAGAARGRMNWDRITNTLSFIGMVNAPHFVWVNPMPRARWENTTAEAIALQTGTMFASEPLEFRNAIKQLRGKLR